MLQFAGSASQCAAESRSPLMMLGNIVELTKHDLRLTALQEMCQSAQFLHCENRGLSVQVWVADSGVAEKLLPGRAERHWR